MAKQRTLEVVVGAWVILGAILLLLSVFILGDFSTYFQPGYLLRVRFESANGISEGSSVQYAGVEIGKVQAVRLVPRSEQSSPQVELLVRLPTRVLIRADDIAAISTFGLLGEKFLEITPGTGVGPPLEEHGLLVGKPPVSTEDIIERSNEVLSELKLSLQGLNSIVGDQEARIYLKEALQEGRDATRNWKALGERLNIALTYMESGQGSLGKLLYDDELYQRALYFVEDLREHPWKLLVRPKGRKSAVGIQKPE